MTTNPYESPKTDALLVESSAEKNEKHRLRRQFGLTLLWQVIVELQFAMLLSPGDNGRLLRYWVASILLTNLFFYFVLSRMSWREYKRLKAFTTVTGLFVFPPITLMMVIVVTFVVDFFRLP